MIALGTSAAQADPQPHLGRNSSGLAGVGSLLAARAEPGLAVASSVGYGLTESFGPHAGPHQRIAGSLGAAYSVSPWLSAALELRGRLDLHPRDALGKDRTGTGDPYITLHTGHALANAQQLGAALTVWVPGQDAPSIALGATSVELRVLHEKHFESARLSLLSNLGLRLDQSAQSAPDLTRLRYGDRTSLALSEFHGVAWGIALQRSLPRDTAVFGELSGLVLLSGQTEVVRASPLRVAIGGRRFLAQGFEIELALRVSLSGKPSFLPNAPVVPFEPRAQLFTALRWDGARYDESLAAKSAPSNDDALQPTRPATPEPPALASLHGAVRDENGRPLSDCAVSLRIGGATLSTMSAFDGSYEFTQLPSAGAAALTVEARGYAPRTFEVRIAGALVNAPETQLERATSQGVVRLSVRSFGSDALAATVVVKGAHGRALATGRTDASGVYEAALPPGRYRLVLSAKGYRTQTLTVRVSSDEVAIVNVDLREER
jgi:hypothetical protein